MKYVKMLGLAAVAAAALMAFAGAGTASADELCTNVSNPCTKPITVIEASQVGSGFLKDTSGNTLVTCPQADIKMTVTSQGKGVSPILGTVNNLKFTECTAEVTTTNPGTSTAKSAGSNQTTLTSVGGLVDVKLFGVQCGYGTGTGQDLGTVSTGGKLTVNAVVNKVEGGFLCPSTTRWEATFQVTNHNTVDYIVN